MKREDWLAPVIEQDSTFEIGDRVRIRPSRAPSGGIDKIKGKTGVVKSGLCRQTNPASRQYVGYQVDVSGYRDSLNYSGYCLIPAYRLELASIGGSVLDGLLGRIKCAFGSHKMVWGFGSPQPGHCARGCGHREVDAS